jgi:hypothetical protein
VQVKMPVLVILFVLLAVMILLPISLIQRYRVGTMRRRARPWLISINIAGLVLSIGIVLTSAALINIWVPDAFVYTAAGLGAGVALGIVGLALTRWDRAGDGLYYTPNRWLVLAVTLTVAGRIAYGFWRMWQQWDGFAAREAWIETAGLQGALAAGATVLGYYVAYWIGVRRAATRAVR